LRRMNKGVRFVAGVEGELGVECSGGDETELGMF